jgi:hypothetical protein
MGALAQPWFLVASNDLRAVLFLAQSRLSRYLACNVAQSTAAENLTKRPECSQFVLITRQSPLHTLSLLEELRAITSTAWSTTSKLYQRVDALLRQVADPSLPDIPLRLPFRFELWDRSGQQVRWVSSSVTMAHAAFEVAMQTHPHESLTLRRVYALKHNAANQSDTAESS